jgi:hypothetical protein
MIGNRMAKKQFFAVVDTETTIDDTVADFAIVIVDRHGEIHNQMAVMVKDHFESKELFYIPGIKDGWSLEYARAKRAKYVEMLNNGTRMLASVASINAWIAKAIGKYNPVLTAYNLPFDQNKSANTGIDLTGFSNSFCLWQAAVGNICNRKDYRQFCLENHRFNKPTEHGNMTFQTNAEVVSGFLAGVISKEPHTALEDAVYFEVPILRAIIAKRDWKSKITPYNYRDHQVKNHFKAV